jgi:hypothetical protein
MSRATRHPNWDIAEQLLRAVLPGSSSLSIDGLPELPYEIWQPFDIEVRDDEAVHRDLLSHCDHLIGPVVIANDASYEADAGPHFVDAGGLAEFVDSFARNLGFAFVSGNMIIAGPATGDVVAVNDEGLIAHLKGRPAFTLTPHYTEGRHVPEDVKRPADFERLPGLRAARHPNWRLAEHLLRAMRPEASRFSINGLGDTYDENWEPFDIEGRSVEEGARDLVARCSYLSGPLVVVNDGSYQAGPYFVQAGRLAEFAETFPAIAGSAFLSGTMFVIAPATGAIVAVDDEELIAHIKGRPVFQAPGG